MKRLAVACVRNHERFRADNGSYYVELAQTGRIDKLEFVAREESSQEVALFYGSVIVTLALRFLDVLQRLIDGKKYRRHGWVENIYITFDSGQKFVTLHGRTALTRWSPYKYDFDAEDWEEVE